jgi:hypothetical protein
MKVLNRKEAREVVIAVPVAGVAKVKDVRPALAITSRVVMETPIRRRRHMCARSYYRFELRNIEEQRNRNCSRMFYTIRH